MDPYRYAYNNLTLIENFFASPVARNISNPAIGSALSNRYPRDLFSFSEGAYASPLIFPF